MVRTVPTTDPTHLFKLRPITENLCSVATQTLMICLRKQRCKLKRLGSQLKKMREGSLIGLKETTGRVTERPLEVTTRNRGNPKESLDRVHVRYRGDISRDFSNGIGTTCRSSELHTPNGRKTIPVVERGHTKECDQ